MPINLDTCAVIDICWYWLLDVGWSDQPYWDMHLGQGTLASITCECMDALYLSIPQ